MHFSKSNKDFKCINCDTILLDKLILFSNMNIHFGVQLVMKTLRWMIQKKSTKKPQKSFALWKQNTDRKLPKTFFAVKLMLHVLHLLAFIREFCISKLCY